MFDVLLSLFAVANTALEIKGIKDANNPNPNKPEYAKSDLERDEALCEKLAAEHDANPVTEVKMAEPAWKIRQNRLFEQINKEKTEAQKQSEQAQTSESNLVNWVASHDELLIEVMKPGTHIIPSSEMENMDIDEIADFLFKQDSIELVEKVAEGLELTVR